MIRWSPTAGLLFVSLLWGGSFVAVKAALEEATPLAFLSVRFALASAFALFLVRRRPGMRAAFGWGVPLGIVLAASYAAQTIGLVETSPSRSAFITGAGVVAIPFWGIFLLGRRPALQSLLGLALAVYGIWLITDPAGGSWDAGDSWTLACAVLFSLHVVLLTRYGSHEAFALLTSQLLVTAVVTGGLSYWLEPSPRIVWSGRLIAMIALTGIGVSFLATLLQIRLQSLLTPARTAVVFATEPVFAALTSMLLLGERMSVTGWIGGGLVVSGVLLSELGAKPARPLPTIPESLA